MKRKSYLLLALLASSVSATELTHQFKNPSFSGINTGSQWLTIENQEFTRKKTINDKLEAALKDAANQESNSILNRFMNNLQSRIYSQLAQQLTNNLFGQLGDATGSFDLDGNVIQYTKDSENITLTITGSDGNVTKITIPTSGFKF